MNQRPTNRLEAAGAFLDDAFLQVSILAGFRCICEIGGTLGTSKARIHRPSLHAQTSAILGGLLLLVGVAAHPLRDGFTIRSLGQYYDAEHGVILLGLLWFRLAG